MASNLDQTLNDLKAIPKQRLSAKVARSAFGLLFIAGSVAAAWKLAWPWYVVLPVAIFGAHIVSAELTRSAVKLVVATVKDLKGAIKNGGAA